MAFPPARQDVLRKALHLVQDGVDLGHDVLAVDEDRLVRPIAQRHVEHRPALGLIDSLAGEHRLDRLGDARLAGQPQQQFQRLARDPVLGIVHENVFELRREGAETIPVLGEQVLHVHVFDRFKMIGKLFPGLRLRRVRTS